MNIQCMERTINCNNSDGDDSDGNDDDDGNGDDHEKASRVMDIL